MTLDEARTKVESWFTVWPEQGNYHQAATGEPYVVVVSGGLADEAERIPVLCATPEIAIRLWFQAMFDHTIGRIGQTMYWRTAPELDESYFLAVEPDGSSSLDREMRAMLTRKYYTVYSRLLVSDKPRIQPAALPPQAA